MHKKYFKFQLKKKLKILQIKQFKALSGFLAPRQYVDTNIWTRLTVDQLMAKRRAALFFKKPKISNNLKKTATYGPVLANRRKVHLSPFGQKNKNTDYITKVTVSRKNKIDMKPNAYNKNKIFMPTKSHYHRLKKKPVLGFIEKIKKK